MDNSTVNEKSELAKEIKAIRLDRGWSQKRMANVLGISRQTLNRFELGHIELQELTEHRVRKELSFLTAKIA